MNEFVGDESFKSPELLRLEREVQLMEAQMDAAFEQFQNDSAENERSIDIDLSAVLNDLSRK